MTNCQIVRSLRHSIICKFMSLSFYWQWELANKHARISAVANLSESKAKAVCVLELGGWNILNISPRVYFEETPWIVLSHRKFLSSVWHFLACLPIQWVRNEAIFSLTSHIQMNFTSGENMFTVFSWWSPWKRPFLFPVHVSRSIRLFAWIES